MTRLIAIVAASAVFCAVGAIAQTAATITALSVDEMLDQLESQEIAAEPFHQWVGVNFESLPATDLWRVIDAALGSEEPGIVETALTSTSVLIAMDEAQRTAAPMDRITALSRSSNGAIRGSAIKLLALLNPQSAGSEQQLALRLRAEKDEDVSVLLIKLIGAGGVQTDEGERALLTLARGDTGRASHRALLYLLLQPRPPDTALEPAIEAINSEDFFADPNLVQNLPKFGASVQRYLPQLEALRDRLVEQLAMPRADRSVQIYNDEVYLATLQDTIESIALLQ